MAAKHFQARPHYAADAGIARPGGDLTSPRALVRSPQPPRAITAITSAELRSVVRVMPILNPVVIPETGVPYLGDSPRISKLSTSSNATPIEIAESPILTVNPD